MSFQDDQVFLEKYLDEHLNTVLGLRLAETYISTDNLEGAHQTLTEFLESHPDNATAMFLLGEIAFKEGDNEKAQNLYEETIQTDPSYTAAYHRLVTISADRGDQTTVKEIYALLNRLNPLDTRAAAEVGDKESATSLNSDFSKKVLNQFTLTTAEPEDERKIEQDAEPIETATVEEDENIISSESFSEPENISLGSEEVKTDIEVEELTDEEGSFDLDSAGETKEPEVTESDESSSEEAVTTDSEESDEFGVPKESEESNDADNETDAELSESEEPTESKSEEPEEDNPFGVGGADEADEEETEEESVEQPDNETVEEPVVEETDSDAEETSEETASETSDQDEDPFGTDEVAEETTEEEDSAEEQTEDEADEVEQTEEDSGGSEEVAEKTAEDEDSAEEQTEEESEEPEEDETTEAEDEDPFGSDEVAEETTEEEDSAEEQTEEDEATETKDEEESEDSEEDEESAEEQTEDESSEDSEDEAGAESTDIADSIVDKESRGFELPPFSKETLEDIKIDNQNESDESKSDEGNSNLNQDEGAAEEKSEEENSEKSEDTADDVEQSEEDSEVSEEDEITETQNEDPFGSEEIAKDSGQDEEADGLNIPLDSSDDSDNADNIETATENMIDESGAEEHNIPIDEEKSTEDAGSDTPSDYESWVDKDVTPGSMTSGEAENDNNINKNTFEGLLSKPDVAVETMESENPDEEESEGTIKEEIEDFQKKVDNIYNLDEEEEVSPLQAWFLERNSSVDEEVADKEEIKTDNIDPPLTEPMSVPFSEENSQDESDSDNSEENGKAWDDFVETTSESKKSSVKADSAMSEESESVATEVDRDLQNIFDDVVTTESDDTDKKEDDAEDSKSASIGGVKLSNDLATFTLAEIYSNQGQYTEALSVLDLLEEKDKDLDKIKSMREEIKEKIEARNK